MSISEPSGWDPMEARHWPVIADSLPRPWPREAVLHDLRWWSARERMGDGRRPGRPVLEARWGWTGHRARMVMLTESEWGDPRESTANRQRIDSESTANRQAANGRTVDIVEVPTANRQRIDSESTANRPTRVGSQSTEHRAQSTEDETAPVPVAPPVKPSGRKPKAVKPKPDLTADLSRVLDAFQTIDPVRAQKARDGTNAGVIDEATKAIRLLGVDRIVTRLRWVGANMGHKDVRWLMENQGWGALFVHGKPMVNRFDDAAAMLSSAPETGPAADAWTDVSALPGWQRFASMRPAPNRPDSHGNRDGFDLHPDPTEHARRWHAYRAAGGSRAWFDATTPDAEAAFGARFCAAYPNEASP